MQQLFRNELLWGDWNLKLGTNPLSSSFVHTPKELETWAQDVWRLTVLGRHREPSTERLAIRHLQGRHSESSDLCNGSLCRVLHCSELASRLIIHNQDHECAGLSCLGYASSDLGRFWSRSSRTLHATVPSYIIQHSSVGLRNHSTCSRS